jgi:hypothetical protein
LRATHVGQPSHNTIIGHSYGGVAVGVADRDATLPVDDIILIGNPGVGVEHAADFSVGADHVWASRAPGDIIAAVDLVQVVPTESGFGARTFTSDGPSGVNRYLAEHGGLGGQLYSGIAQHSSYFDPNSAGHENMVNIITGHAERVH